MELKMKDICEGRKTRNDVVQESLDQYREVFTRTSQQIDVLKAVRTSASSPSSQSHVIGISILHSPGARADFTIPSLADAMF